MKPAVARPIVVPATALFAVAAALAVLLRADAPPPAKPPVAAVREHTVVVHGVARSDPYFWLRERGDKDVLAYLEAENAYTAAVMKPTEPLQEKLFAEMKGRLKEADQSVPAPDGPYEYYTRVEEGKQYKVHCRRARTPSAAEEVILDENALAEGHEHFALGDIEISPDHKRAAYIVDFTGREVFTLQIKDLIAGETLADSASNVYYTLAWASDGQHVFYTTLDEALRPYRVYCHAVGAPASQDRLVYEEPDERFHATVQRTRSGAYVLINLESQITTETRFVPADRPDAPPRVLLPREQGVEYHVDHGGESFYVLTNKDAKNFQLLSLPAAEPSAAGAEVLIPHDPAVMLAKVSAFEGFLGLEERRGGLSAIRVFDLKSGASRGIDFPEPAYTVSLGENREFATRTLRYQYSSLATPPSTYDLKLDTFSSELRKREEVRGYDPEKYATERLLATAPDGVRVPISLVYRKDLRAGGPQPLLLEGYGAYGISNDPEFLSWSVSLLDRGMIYAIAHVRGGGEMGRAWYEDGKLLHKRNTFTDFIACAEHLVAQRYTAPDRLAILGGSAGGLLIGAVTNMRPELFKAVVAHVPFVDVVNTMLDASIPLTVIEYEEWGNPNERPFYDYMMSYSPYDNVTAQAYPNLLITAGLNDPRVQYWEPAKWTARLRAAKTDSNRLLLRTNMGAGHAGASGRYARLKERAFESAFILDVLGLRGD